MPDRSRTRLRTDLDRGEKVSGLAWLSAGAFFSALIAVVYLGSQLTLPGGVTVAFPWPILAAAWFNAVLTRTAKLWGTNVAVALIPLAVWCAGLLLLFIGPEVTRELLVGNNILALALLAAGIMGGLWPVFRGK